MALFDHEAEAARKLNLKKMEDSRLKFAEKLAAEGFRPEKMLFCSTEMGSFVALARHNNQQAVIVSPVFGQEGDFIIEYHDRLEYRKEEIHEAGTGLNGAFGFGTKGAVGFKLFIRLNDGSEAELDVVCGRTSFLETNYSHNPLLKTKRRRGDANVVWDLTPIERKHVEKIEAQLNNYYLA